MPPGGISVDGSTNSSGMSMDTVIYMVRNADFDVISDNIEKELAELGLSIEVGVVEIGDVESRLETRVIPSTSSTSSTTSSSEDGESDGAEQTEEQSSGRHSAVIGVLTLVSIAISAIFS